MQSSTMALMAGKGLIGPMPDYALFANTGWEPKATYAYLDRLEGLLAFPVVRVQRANLRDALLAGGFAAVPFYTPGGIGARQCTYQFKLRPIYRHIRNELVDIRRKRCELWVGISRDETVRMKPARVRYIENRWPLIELGMTRQDCLSWLRANGYPEPPKSACLGCPFHRDGEWRALRDGSPEEWAQTVADDKAIRAGGRDQYMHRSCVPLDQVDLSTLEDHGQLNLFNNECEGMCGV